MHAFAELMNRLAFTGSRNAKLDLMQAYFRTTPDPDRGIALAALTDGLNLRLPFRRLVAELLEPHVDPVLYKLSRDYVGDTAETVSLLWPVNNSDAPVPSLSEIHETLQSLKRADAVPVLSAWLDALDPNGRWALLKLVTGGLRIGVSARLAKTAIAQAFDHDVAEVEEIWHSIELPYENLFAWLEGSADRPDPGDTPVFRPVMLAHPLEDGDLEKLAPSEWVTEWKWDGIRVQLSGNGRDLRLYSRTGDDISKAFPDIADAFLGFCGVADGELLVMRDGNIAPFNDLQQRLNRKTVSAAMVKNYPAHIRFYDLLFSGSEDIRTLDFTARRKHLEDLLAANPFSRASLSEVIEFKTFDDLTVLRDGARDANIEGLMLKRIASAYLAGRPRGHWFKWKRDALTADCVMMYAQRGSGKRSSFYSDYTFGAWRTGEDGEQELVPVGKAYSGFTDAELKKLDKFVRDNTTDRFGPVRAVEPELVFEVAFDAVQPSTRHKSGIAMRFPRIHRIRWDKPAGEADHLDALLKLIAR
ncbi:cisplatin damage response ATP-dependent DNA ligase [Anderseniella sp. Alg231-50]|uniref:cisplatin damage response ATP-dependent DNA ligase n=1 Tax=Anderseniella sp. Alg231-50 TaxID=1922226 RepID=UPI000D55A52A